MSLGGLVWGGVSIVQGVYTLSVIPIGYAVLTSINMLVLHATKDFQAVRFLQMAMSVLLPFLFQWLMGGFRASGSIALWGLIPVTLSLTFYSTQISKVWLLLYIMLMIASIWQHDIIPITAVISSEAVQQYFLVINICLISSMTFGLILFFKQRSEHQQKELSQSYQELQIREEEIKQNLEELTAMNDQIVAAKNRLQRTFDMERKARESMEQRDMELYRTMKALEKKEAKNREQAIQLHEAHQELQQQFQLIKTQNETIEKWNNDITQNIRYARRIQLSLMGKEKELRASLPHSFVLEKPRDLVGGDFYWFSQLDDLLILVVADCTGHGVSGSLMSIVGISLLNDIINAQGILNPSMILEELDIRLKRVIGQHVIDGHQVNDGMDAGIVTIDIGSRNMQFAGAHTPLNLLRKGEILTYKGSKCPIGGFQKEGKRRVYQEHSISIEPNDRIFMGSDGLQDQFGGPEKRKLLSKRLRAWLADLQDSSIFTHKQQLAMQLIEWQGKEKQTDDILLIGIEFDYATLHQSSAHPNLESSGGA